MPREEQGVFTERYKVIPRTLIFLFSDDAVLLLKGAPTKKLWANRYNGIGGHIERGEDILSAAYRELSEEIGLGNIRLHLVGTVMVDADANTGISIYVFRGDTQRIEPPESSEGSLEWITLNELDDIPLVEDLPVLLPLVAASSPESGHFTGIYRYNDKNELEVNFRVEE